MGLSKTSLGVLSVLCLCSIGLCQVSRYEVKYLKLPVDHFSFQTDDTFELRYLVNDTFTAGNSDAPILFYCGNEANIELFANSTGFIWEFAPKINALVVFAEHRYYGRSQLRDSRYTTGTNHYGYLTIEQTLADFAALIEHLNAGASRNRPAIAVGGSYGGILAALFRMKYPHLVAGALASSAPLKQFSNATPCEDYSRVITHVFRTAYNEHCASNIKRSWTVFRDVANQVNGVEFFNELFNFCEPWQNPSSVEALLDGMNNAFWDMSMTNYPYEADVYTSLPANPVRAFCSHLDVEYDGEPLVKALRKALNVYVNPKGDKKCFKFPEHKVMQTHEREAWSFQRCSEILTGMCDRSDQSMFPEGGANFEESMEACTSLYGTQVRRSFHRIKNHFGVPDLRTATNIIFSNGLLDPWSAASVLTAPNDQTLVINIPEGAHHIDLRGSNKMDPTSVRQARALEELYLRKWMRLFRRRSLSFM